MNYIWISWSREFNTMGHYTFLHLHLPFMLRFWMIVSWFRVFWFASLSPTSSKRGYSKSKSKQWKFQNFIKTVSSLLSSWLHKLPALPVVPCSLGHGVYQLAEDVSSSRKNNVNKQLINSLVRESCSRFHQGRTLLTYNDCKKNTYMCSREISFWIILS